MVTPVSAEMTRPSRSCLQVTICLLVFLCCGAASSASSQSSGTADGSEEWGYVDVRQGAHMFWWLYITPNQITTDWPILLWLQGGPGGSGVGTGNFGEIGPLTMALLPRQYTWLHKAHLLFVDSPVGAGFSYADNESLLLTNDKDVTTDLVNLLQKFFEDHQKLQSSPLFIFAQSYGGKHATLLGLALNEAIEKGYVKAKLGGIALGNSWISPVDSVLSWGPVLRTFSRIDGPQEDVIIRKAKTIQEDIDKGAYLDAAAGRIELVNEILRVTDSVNFYNLLLDFSQDSLVGSLQAVEKGNTFLRSGSYLESKQLKETNQSVPNLPTLMNGSVRKKLQIIPDTVTWEGLSGAVFAALQEDFMKDEISKVDELLSSGVNVTIYSGQLDLVCANQGTEAWVQKLRWPGMSSFQGAARKPLYCNGANGTAAFAKTYKNLAYYWILLAGHMVPADNPCIALEMVGLVTKSP
ncbi:hypothetical protein L7F22_025366 [Adiantum nelumboides]|nr:hypothetical protein [Adiantum nelumboides]